MLMEISRIVFDPSGLDSPTEVKRIDLLTSDLVIFDLEDSSDGTFKGGKFGLSYFLKFFRGEEELDWESVMSSRGFLFGGKEVEIGTRTDPLVLAQLEAVCRKLGPHLVN